ncbi:uncharacterized protein BDZ99DRAFT_509534 [Mytilinidion resinicola]|uniref:Adenylyltransferase and sulfurtransferase uba4 n=1 Tax=Mytilinidion resinicola TaxID=574789 RepID=A0A6A6YJQ9_9PEZI|nr:uncharacterized protein BDZ99DRAFT_509534 [Mytilinidion resinicola]KAF2808195.1 hypothetical protein BDZ99DRAFT_509534 [Mytilinidion resinicola]
MTSRDAQIVSLRNQIASCEVQLQRLRDQLLEAENDRDISSRDTSGQISLGLGEIAPESLPAEASEGSSHQQNGDKVVKLWPLDKHEYRRYGRQLIMPEIGLTGQLRLKSSSVLVVGAGGLGCPAAAYLAGAGVGMIGLIDGDTVEESNLHRQILHSTERVAMPKVDSAIASLRSLNPTVKYIPYHTRLTAEIALDIFEKYDVILDCTDTPASRYLISDACVLSQKPLVSASALRTDGQLMVLNNPPLPPGHAQGGPCYRCVFPKPPPAASVVSCGDGGILGPVVGTMGVLQALETIKIIAKGIQRYSDFDSTYLQKGLPSGNSVPDPHRLSEPPSLLLFSAFSNPPFRSIRLRTRKAKCSACSAQTTVTREALKSGSLDYVQFCGAVSPVDALAATERVSVEEYSRIRDGSIPAEDTKTMPTEHILVDVREKVQFELCNLDGSMNIPYSIVARSSSSESGKPSSQAPSEDDWVAQLRTLANDKPIYVVCRLGNDSQLAVRKMKEMGLDSGGTRWIGDIRNGLRAWMKRIDPDFPEY